MQILKKFAAWTGGYEKSTNQPSETEQSSQKKEVLAFERVRIHELVNRSKVSTRLSNVVKHPDFPFNTIDEYLNHAAPIEALKRVQNIGSKTAKELDALIKNFTSSPKYLENVEQKNKLGPESSISFQLREKLKPLLQQFSFPQSLQNFPLSTRLMNTLQNMGENEERKYKNLYLCLEEFEEFNSFCLRQQNFGRTSLKELHDSLYSILLYIVQKSGISKDAAKKITSSLLGKDNESNISEEELKQFLSLDIECSNISFLEVHSSINDELADHYKNILEEDNIIPAIKPLLNEREFDILQKRFGLTEKRARTLDEISQQYSCTRERIRQLEKKALKKLFILKKSLSLSLEEHSNEIEKIIFDDIPYFSKEETTKQFRNLPGKYRMAIQICYGKPENYMNKKFSKQKSFWINKNIESEKLAYIKQHIQSGVAGQSLEIRVIDALHELKWPISLEDIQSKMPDIPIDTIRWELIENFGADLEGNVIKKFERNLRSSLRLIMVLRYAGRALTLGEARHYHQEMFGKDILEHNIGAVLGRLEEALIVDRGKYSLYNNLSLSASDVHDIRNSSYVYLSERQVFTSTKRIYDDIYLGQHPYGYEFNSYMLLGILQDDPRFIYKRGLMVGLNTFSEEDFIGLNQRLYRIVDEFGPIDLKAIQEKLSSDRKVLDVTVNIVLEDSPEHIKIAPSNYDRIDRVIGDQIAQKHLKYATELALLDGDITPYYLRAKLKTVGFDLNEYLLSSWLGKLENVKKSAGIISLETCSAETENYTTFLKQIKSELPNDDINFIKGHLPKDIAFMVDLDSRLFVTKNKSDGKKTDELDNLIKEFEF